MYDIKQGICMYDFIWFVYKSSNLWCCVDDLSNPLLCVFPVGEYRLYVFIWNAMFNCSEYTSSHSNNIIIYYLYNDVGKMYICIQLKRRDSFNLLFSIFLLFERFKLFHVFCILIFQFVCFLVRLRYKLKKLILYDNRIL